MNKEEMEKRLIRAGRRSKGPLSLTLALDGEFVGRDYTDLERAVMARILEVDENELPAKRRKTADSAEELLAIVDSLTEEV